MSKLGSSSEKEWSVQDKDKEIPEMEEPEISRIEVNMEEYKDPLMAIRQKKVEPQLDLQPTFESQPQHNLSLIDQAGFLVRDVKLLSINMKSHIRQLSELSTN